MQFQIPQFIEVEDKVFGPFTIKQFIYLAGGGGIVFLLFKILPVFFAALVSFPVVALALALAFYKMNNRPFIFMLESAFRYFLTNKLYIWKKVPKELEQKKGEEQETKGIDLFVPRLSGSRLKDLAWSLDIKNAGPGAQETMTR